MTKDEITEYRKVVEKDFSDKDLEIETTLSYITIGALGFFITINDKFIQLQTAKCRLILIISLALIFISFALLLYRKSITTASDLKLLDYVTNMKTDSVEDDAKLLNLWDESHKCLERIKNWVYVSLGIGIGLQVLFLTINIY